MPLSEEQKRMRRTVKPDILRDQDIFRVAEALERIADSLETCVPTLRKIEEHLGLAALKM